MYKFLTHAKSAGCVCLLFISVPCQIKTAYKTLAPSTQKQRLRCDPWLDRALLKLFQNDQFDSAEDFSNDRIHHYLHLWHTDGNSSLCNCCRAAITNDHEGPRRYSSPMADKFSSNSKTHDGPVHVSSDCWCCSVLSRRHSRPSLGVYI